MVLSLPIAVSPQRCDGSHDPAALLARDGRRVRPELRRVGAPRALAPMRELHSVWFIWDTLFHFLPEALAGPEVLPPVERVPQRLRVGGADGVPLGDVHRRVEVDGVVA